MLTLTYQIVKLKTLFDLVGVTIYDILTITMLLSINALEESALPSSNSILVILRYGKYLPACDRIFAEIDENVSFE